MPSEREEMDSLKGKVNVLAGALRLGHEAFRKSGAEGVASHIVNSSRMLSDYGRSCVIDLRGISPAVLAVSGEPLPKQDSEYCLGVKRLASSLPPLGTMRIVNSLSLKDLPPKAQEAFAELSAGRPESALFAIPLPRPGEESAPNEPGFIWIVEFFEGAKPHDAIILELLAQHYAEVLWHNALAHPGALSALLSLKGLYTAKAALAALAALVLCLAFIRVRQYAVADFEMAPAQESVCYSQLQGTLRKVVKANGEAVSPGDAVLLFDVDELKFRLASAQKDFEQVSAELDSATQKSFASPELIAKAQLLEIKKEHDRIEIERTKWMLAKSELKAPIKGVVVMDVKERMEGKAVKPGDKLFEIIPPDSLVAEIALSERDASVLGPGMSVSLYLHTQPETPIRGALVSVSPKPILTDDRRFCYVIKFKPEAQGGLICGMRGVARVGGAKVSLGYHLFRSALLWWRKL